MVAVALPAGRSLLRLAVAGAVALGIPVALAESAQAGTGGRWDRIAQWVISGKWSTNSGNGYYGGLQFSARTWKAFGGTGMPHRASRAQQIKVAERILVKQGWRAWPACSRKLGYRR